jgi:hypothetical protein
MDGIRMSGIEELRNRVAAVEEQFGLAHEQRTKYSARLLSMMDALDARMRDQKAEIARQADELGSRAADITDLTARAERGEHDNEQLRGMLHSLLKAIEAGSRDVFAETMQALEAKVTALIADTAPAAAESAPQDDIAPEVPDVEAVAEDAPADPIEEMPEVPQAETAAEDAPADPIEEVPEEAAPEPDDFGEAAADETFAEVAEIAPEPVSEAAPEPIAEVGEEVADAGDIEPMAAAESDMPAPAASDDSVTLAAIMQRVSKLLDEDELSGAPDGADTVAEAETEPEPEPESESAADDVEPDAKQASGND